MFVLRCLGVSLAFFLAQYCLLSALIARGWNWPARGMRRWSPRNRANYLFALRMLPLVGALVSTAIFVLPSFLLLEPRVTNEAVGRTPEILSACCLLLVAFGVYRGIGAQARSARAVAEWLRDATPFSSCAYSAAPVFPVYEIRTALPALTVVGVCDPRVLVSAAATQVLDSREMSTALQHEMAHIRHRDNLKKLCFNFTAFPGMTGLEAAWNDAGEMAADDAAVATSRDALDLASALIKLSRLGRAPMQTQLAMGLVSSSTASLNSRIERLLAWRPISGEEAAPQISGWGIGLGVVFACSIFVSYGAVLQSMHEVTEWLVR